MKSELMSKWLGRIGSLPYIYHILIIGLYTILTIAFTFPVIETMTTSMAGEGDAWQILYILWYAKQAFLAGNPGMTMSFTNYLFYPNGSPLIFSSFSLFDQLLGIPLQLIFGLAATYNILWMLSFIIGGYGAFLLVRYLTGNDAAAFIGGMIFTFSPYHFSQGLEHIGATTIEWIPFCALFLIKAFREKSIKSTAVAGIFFILVAMSDSQYMVFMGLFSVLLFVFEMAVALKMSRAAKKENKPHSGQLKSVVFVFAIFSCVGLAGAIPLNYDLIHIAFSGSNYLKPDISEAVFYSGDLAGFFTPSSLQPIFGSWLATNIYSHFTGNVMEYTTYAGMAALLLSILAIITGRKEKYVKFWAISALFFAVMVLGPALHVFGLVRIPFYPGFIPLPYLAFYYFVPFMSDSRTVSRFDVILMMSLAVLAGYGVARILKSLRNSWSKVMVTAIIAVFIAFEFSSVPAISTLDTPTIYKQMAQDKSQYAVIEIPCYDNYDSGIRIEYYDTIDGKQMVGGWLPRAPENVSDFEKNTPFINDLVNTNDQGDIFVQNDTQIGNYVLNYYNIQYVIIHKWITDDNKPSYIIDYETLWTDEDLLNKALGTGPAYEDDDLVAYHVNQTDPRLFMAVGNGWSGPITYNNETWRWMGNTSTINVVSPDNGTYTLGFDASGVQSRPLQVLANGTLVLSAQLTTDSDHFEVPVQLHKGDNTITFNSPDGSDLYPDFSSIGSSSDYSISCQLFPDQNGGLTYRYSSFMFMNVTLEPLNGS